MHCGDCALAYALLTIMYTGSSSGGGGSGLEGDTFLGALEHCVNKRICVQEPH